MSSFILVLTPHVATTDIEYPSGDQNNGSHLDTRAKIAVDKALIS